MKWRVQLLGGPAISQGSREITHFESRKVVALLAYLALYPQRPHPREELIELLWPEVEPETGRHRLRQALSSLRRQLEPPGTPYGSVLIADRHAVRLNPEAFTCDAADFERLVRQKRYAEAKALYVGDLLPGFYDDWILQERDRLAQITESLPTADSIPEEVEEREPANEGRITPLPYDGRITSLPNYLTRFFGREEEMARLTALLGVGCRVSGVGRPTTEDQQPKTKLGAASNAPTQSSVPDRLGPAALGPRPQSSPPDTRHPTPDARLITLTGSGGSGKTRLAVEAARQVTSAFDTVAFVPLAECRSLGQIPEHLRAALHLPASDTPAFEQVTHVLAGRKALLILDNFEHLVEAGGAALIEMLLDRLPDLTCLLTSRRLPGIVGEQEFPLAPLPLPPDDGPLLETAQNPSIALFLNRAQAARPGFRITERNQGDLAALCRALEGMPLALELAASRIRVLSPAEMRSQIEDRFQWLVRSGPGADKEPRHRSLAATLEWSWRLLSPSQQRFLSALTVFRGGWTADTAVAVSGTEDARERLESLVMDSLVLSEETPDGTTRFRMLETVRSFARERLVPEEALALRRGHRAAFLTLAEQSANSGTGLLAEAENLTTALETAIEDQEAETCVALCVALDDRLMGLAGAERALMLLKQTLSLRDNEAGMRVQILSMASHFALYIGDTRTASELAAEGLQVAGERPVERARALLAEARILIFRHESPAEFGDRLQEVVGLAQAAGETRIQANALRYLGLRANRLGQLVDAQRFLTDAVRLSESVGDAQGAIHALDNLGNTALLRGDYDPALKIYEECERRAVEIGDLLYQAKVYQNLATIYARQARWEESLSAGRECIRRNQALGNAHNLAYALWNLPEALAHLGHDAEAAQLMAFADRFWREKYGSLTEADISYRETIRVHVEQTLRPARTAALWNTGESLTLPHAISLALAE